jgi:DNA invertase Pin-like site-specific DNA recombinase
MKSVTYARVSSKEQQTEGYSLPSQEKLFKDYAERKGFSVSKKFSISESANGQKQRKTFFAMLDYVVKNKIFIIICEKVDRLTRNMKDAVAINEWLEGNPERQIHFVKQNLIIHKNSKSDEKFRWDIEVVLARKYITNLSEEVKKGQKEKLAQGWLPQRAKIGYMIAGEKGHKIHIIDNIKAPLMKKMFELYSTGNHSLSTITETMRKEGLRNERNKPVSRSRIHDLLSDPFYYGKIVWMGETSDGKHEPLISKELFDAVQEKLSAKFGGKIKYRKHFYTFKSKMNCDECGGTIAWEMQKGQLYGHCNHHKKCSQQKWVKQNEVEKQLIPLFLQAAPKNARILKWLESALKEGHSNEIEYNTGRKEEINKIIKIADQRIEGAYRDKLDGRMPIQLCEKIIKESTAEKGEAINSLGKLNESRAAYYQAGYSIHELALHAKEIYESEKATPEEQRLLLNYSFSNLHLNDGVISSNYTFAFEFLIKWMPKLNSIFEPTKMPSFTNKTDDFSSVCTTKRG